MAVALRGELRPAAGVGARDASNSRKHTGGVTAVLAGYGRVRGVAAVGHGWRLAQVGRLWRS